MPETYLSRTTYQYCKCFKVFGLSSVVRNECIHAFTSVNKAYIVCLLKYDIYKSADTTFIDISIICLRVLKPFKLHVHIKAQFLKIIQCKLKIRF